MAPRKLAPKRKKTSKLTVFPEQFKPVNSRIGEFHQALKDNEKEVYATLVPDAGTMSRYNFSAAIRNMLTNIGLELIINCELPTYPRLVEEFLASFHSSKDEDGDIQWTFSLGNQLWTWSKKQICEHLQFPEEGIILEYSNSELDAFWLKISALDYPFLPETPSSCIKDPVWKYAHRLIAMSINARAEGGTRIHRKDMNVLYAMDQGTAIDLVDYLTGQFENWRVPACSDKCLGGGLFITKIAVACGFDLSRVPSLGIKSLDEPSLNSMKMKTGSFTWQHRTTLPDKLLAIIGKREAAHKNKDKRKVQKPASSKDASISQLEAKIDLLLQSQSWMQAMYLRELRRRGDTSYPPPPVFPDHSWEEMDATVCPDIFFHPLASSDPSLASVDVPEKNN